MINSLYQLVNKGSWRALSFVLAFTLTLSFFFNLNQFVTELRSVPAYWVLLILWSVVILWIHGIGFDIRSMVWKILFFPFIGYIIGVSALVSHFFF